MYGLSEAIQECRIVCNQDDAVSASQLQQWWINRSKETRETHYFMSDSPCSHNIDFSSPHHHHWKLFGCKYNILTYDCFTQILPCQLALQLSLSTRKGKRQLVLLVSFSVSSIFHAISNWPTLQQSCQIRVHCKTRCLWLKAVGLIIHCIDATILSRKFVWQIYLDGLRICTARSLLS